MSILRKYLETGVNFEFDTNLRRNEFLSHFVRMKHPKNIPNKKPCLAFSTKLNDEKDKRNSNTFDLLYFTSLN